MNETTTTIECPQCGAVAGQWCFDIERDEFGRNKKMVVRGGNLLTHSARKIETEELFCEWCDRPVDGIDQLHKSGHNGMVCADCWEERPWKY
jgi:hypothetical protein